MNQVSSKWVQVLFLGALITTVISQATEEEAQRFLDEAELKNNELCYNSVSSDWLHHTNISEETTKAAAHHAEMFAYFKLEVQKIVNNKFSNWKTFKNRRLRRAFKYLAMSGPANMDINKVRRLYEVINYMLTSYSTATICKYGDPTDCKHKLRDLSDFLHNAHDTKEMEHYWTQWHDAMSIRVPVEIYAEFVELLNLYGQANGYKSAVEIWMEPYDDESEGWSFEDFEKMMITLERQVAPMYDILHAWVRWKLRQVPKYKDLIKPCGYIPAHLLGNIWGSDWTKLDDITKPFPEAHKLDATDAMIKQGYTPLRMFEEADKMFRSIGLMGVFPEFFNKSILEKPKVGEIGCHATAWDLCKGKDNTDFRILMCTKVNQHDFVVVHHELGHIQYFMQCRDQPFVFREGANPGFHEAIGDALALAVVTPGHLQCDLKLDLGLPAEFCQKIKTGPYEITETDLNYLYFTALQKIAFLPFAVSIDGWRWDIMDGRAKPSEYQFTWWESRRRYQGIVPPADRKNNSTLFDAVTKFHIAANVDFVRYYVAGVLAFDFYQAMCIAAGEYYPDDPKSKPLYMCDFTGSKEAGALMAKMLQMGFSRGWPDALEAITGRRTMSLDPMRHYLQPILDYMEKELKAAGELIGFGYTGKETEDCDEVREIKSAPALSVEELWKMFKEGTLY